MGVPIKHFLGPRGTLLRDGLEFRHEQMEMAESVEESISAATPLLIEAGTGVGKSLAYLLPAALAAHDDKLKVLVSTHTKALQEQLVRKDLPFLSSALALENIPFSFALFMGSENYLCMRRFHQALRDANALFVQESALVDLAQVKSFVDAHPAPKGQSGLRMDLPNVTDDVWRNIHRESDNCMAAQSPFYRDCYHHDAQERMKSADILVVNHALFFANLASGGRVLPKYDVVILDEAHSVEDVAAAHMGISLTNNALRWLLDQICHLETERGLALRFTQLSPAWRKGVTEQTRTLRRCADDFFAQVIESLKITSPNAAVRVRKARVVMNTLSTPLEELAGTLREGRDGLETPEDKQELKAYADRIQAMAAGLDVFLRQEDPMLVYWVEVEKRARGTRIHLRASPIDLSRALKTTLFHADAPTAILTSATLTVKNDFDFVHSRIGSAGVREVTLGSPFDYERQCLIYLPENVPDPAEEDAYYKAAEGETRKLIELAGGGVFVLCTSHDWVNRLFRGLSENLADYKFFKQGGPRSYELLGEFRRSQKAVLIGTDTFWQGVDVPGEALRLVVVTRLPFAMPTHPLEEAKIENLRSQGLDPFNRHTLPTAVLMLRQGFGRLIRRQDDRGVVAILDPRIRSRSYGSVFLKSLPAARVTSKLPDVKRFFNKV